MPHAELKYSSDLTLDAAAILAKIEATIQAHDDSAGACKGRAYPTDHFHHSHLAVSVSLLAKPHRDDAFCNALLTKIESCVRAQLTQPCAVTFGLDFLPSHYSTGTHEI